MDNTRTLFFSPEFKQKFGLPVPSKSFEKHVELDDFASYCMSKDEQFQTNWSAEYDLLKAFDRAFWMQRRKGNQENSDPSPKGCAFVAKAPVAVQQNTSNSTTTTTTEQQQPDEAFEIDDDF